MGHADLPPPTLAVEISECVVMMLKNVYVKILNFCFHSDWREISHPEQILAGIFMLQLLFVSLIKHNSEGFMFLGMLFVSEGRLADVGCAKERAECEDNL